MKRHLYLILIFTLAVFHLPSPLFSATNEASPLPKKAELSVPFLCQAPNGNWAQPWQEACEEANIIMAMHWVNGKPLDKKTGNDEIFDLVMWEIKNWKSHPELTAAQAVKLMRLYCKYDSARLYYKFGVEDIKKELASGNIVIAPMAGRLLGNRYYRRPGPAYHYMLFKGYDDNRDEFITNDSGTKRGQSFRYKYDVAYNAIHDWNGSKETISTGRKAIIVITK